MLSGLGPDSSVFFLDTKFCDCFFVNSLGTIRVNETLLTIHVHVYVYVHKRLFYNCRAHVVLQFFAIEIRV